MSAIPGGAFKALAEWHRRWVAWRASRSCFVYRRGGEVPVPPELLMQARDASAIVLPKDSRNPLQPSSCGRLLAAYNDVVVLSPPNERMIVWQVIVAQACSLGGVGMLGLGALMLIETPPINDVLAFPFIAAGLLMALMGGLWAAVFGAVELRRLLLGPKRLPLAFNRATGEVHRLSAERLPVPFDMRRLWDWRMHADVLRYALGAVRPVPVVVETFDWDSLTGKCLAGGGLCLHAASPFTAAPHEQLLLLANDLTPRAEALLLWEYLRGFMEDDAPAAPPGDPPAANWSTSWPAALKTFAPWWSWVFSVPVLLLLLNSERIASGGRSTDGLAFMGLLLAIFAVPALTSALACVLAYRLDRDPMFPPELESRWGAPVAR